MRLRLTFHTGARELRWEEVLAPGRALSYALLERGAPELGKMLHVSGWGPYGMVPFGYSAPVFPAARRRRGAYAAGGPGVVELGSPLPGVVEGWAAALASVPVLAWGSTAFIVDGIEVVEDPVFASGRAVFRTVTPVVMKVSGRDESGARVRRQAWCLPGEPEWDVYVQGNLRRKAETLGLDADVTLEEVSWVGPKRSFMVAGAGGAGGKKPGACVEVVVSGAPETLSAVASWGVGQANSAGMGWIGV
ncbi:CRISPR-associated endoribonuclease Cas6 [Streptomyces sp. AM 4-1-1]|uniref:CRISPR-associated endoribonuclease Cas6 n=1 Tax=unclassified Streptomyces TaxID=2593676 RepID=UPI0023B97466|nr:CRISPR-associated endoribonuclease Cas6 [Streptomyces sp. AM 4-1-1]WEH37210.1 CRISPR-associated endoribonuclease Cas6 [Streptomyces sp. AM 4-1-1]